MQRPTSVFWIRAVFAVNGFGIATWFPRIPDVKAALEVDLFIFSLCLLMLPIGTLTGFSFGTRLVTRLGTRKASMLAGVAFSLAFLLPALSTSALGLGASLFVAGLTIASIEISINAKAGEIERGAGRRIMSSCHAFWSLGSMAGALAGGAFAELGISFLMQQSLCAPLAALAAAYTAYNLPTDSPSEGTEHHSSTLPSRGLILLAILPMGSLIIEGAMMDWSAIFLRTDVGLSPLDAAIAFSAFSGTMAAIRMAGDRLTERFGPARLLTVSVIAGSSGMFLFALSQNLPMAVFAAALAASGIGNIYPIAMSLAATTPGQRAESAIGSVAFTAFFAFLIGPPLIGALGGVIGLGAALALLGPLTLYPLLLITRVTNRAATEKPA